MTQRRAAACVVSHTVSSRDEPNWNETEVGGESGGESRFHKRGDVIHFQQDPTFIILHQLIKIMVTGSLDLFQNLMLSTH